MCGLACNMRPIDAPTMGCCLVSVPTWPPPLLDVAWFGPLHCLFHPCSSWLFWHPTLSHPRSTAVSLLDEVGGDALAGYIAAGVSPRSDMGGDGEGEEWRDEEDEVEAKV